MELQYLKRFQLQGETPPYIFFQLKEIFHLLESLGSARIEGNRTTIEELVDDTITPPTRKSERLVEIYNIEKAMEFVDHTIKPSQGIRKGFILELHKMVVEALTVEGDPRPGQFRQKPVKITGSSHVPPDFVQVDQYMEELIEFINADYDDKYDFLRTALVHHRFVWIHPFENGNGRVVRLITYAMLIDRGFHGFHLSEGRILNPSAVFCTQRDKYYSMLSAADSGTDDGLLGWCEFMLEGVHDELTKIDRLLDYKYLRESVLTPALNYCREREITSEVEHKVLSIAAKQGTFKAADLDGVLPSTPEVRSRFIAGMRKKKFILPLSNKGRIYTLSLANGPLLRGVIYVLHNEGFVLLENVAAGSALRQVQDEPK
jgi:Fic family protein